MTAKLPTHQSAPYRLDIDGLRAVAVVAVILFHLNPSWLPGGFTGVDIFFVISGYVVTASLSKQDNQNIFDYLLSFYARRIKRLLPALVACVVVTTVFTELFILPKQTTVILASGTRALFGWSNMFFIQNMYI